MITEGTGVKLFSYILILPLNSFHVIPLTSIDVSVGKDADVLTTSRSFLVIHVGNERK